MFTRSVDESTFFWLIRSNGEYVMNVGQPCITIRRNKQCLFTPGKHVILIIGFSYGLCKGINHLIAYW